MTAGLSPFLGDTHQQVELMMTTMRSFLILVILVILVMQESSPKIQSMTLVFQMYENIVAVNFFCIHFLRRCFADIWEHCGSGLHLRRGGLWEQQRSCQGFHTKTVPQRTKVFRTWSFWWCQWRWQCWRWQWQFPIFKLLKRGGFCKSWIVRRRGSVWECLNHPWIYSRGPQVGWSVMSQSISCTNFSSMMIFADAIF